jgi:hypothetical protein
MEYRSEKAAPTETAMMTGEQTNNIFELQRCQHLNLEVLCCIMWLNFEFLQAILFVNQTPY